MSCAAAPELVDSETSIGRPTASPLVTIRIAFQTGSIDDPPGKNGLNALTALMLGRGGTEALTFEELAATLYPWSASVRTQADKEITTIIGEVHRDHLEPFYEILRALVVSPRFDPADFERNRNFLANAIVSSLRGNDDEELGKETLNVLMYAGHPYGSPNVGTQRGLAEVTIDDVRAFHAAQYTRDNFLLGVTGGYPAGFVPRVEQDLTGGLGSIAADSIALPIPRNLDRIELVLVDKQAIATAISIGFPIDVSRTDDDFYPLLVANSYFGEHRTFNGLLMNKMRGDRGLNYGNYAYIESFVQDGGSRFPIPNIPRRQQFFSIWIRPVPHHNAHFALRQALRELEILVTDGLSQEAFETTRDFLLNYSKLYVGTASRRLGYEMDSRFYGTRYYIDEIQERLASLSAADVNQAIRRHLQHENLAVAIVTNGADELRDRLLSNAPSPPAYNAEVTDAVLEEDAEIIEYMLDFNPAQIRIVPVGDMFVGVE